MTRADETATSVWFPRVLRRAAPEVRLLCVGGAGTGPSEFAAWPAEFPESVELWPVQLPGRERRIREAPAARIGDLADQLADAVRGVSEPGVPWALFGHSFGSLVVYELARRIVGELPVRGLIVSAIVVPHQQWQRLPVRSDDDGTLLDWVRAAGGTDPAFLDDPRFAAWLAEDLRVTLRIRRDYAPSRPAPLACPILALGGAGDQDATAADLAEWGEYTMMSFASKEIGVGHFFPRASRREVVAAVVDQLNAWKA